MNMNKNVWSSEDVYIDTCGKYNGNIFNVTLSQDVFIKINILMKKFPRLEWLAYLIGDIDYTKNTAYVNDLIIPKQEVSVAKVYDIGMIKENSIGVIHSHHNMGNFFSSDDKETINKNNDISLLVTHQKITGQIRIKTECGCYYNMEVKVHYDFKHDVDTESWMKIIDENIKEKVVTIPLIKKLNGNSYNISRTQVNRDEDGRDIYEEDHLFDPRGEDDDYNNIFEDEDEDWEHDHPSSDKVLTYEDLVNSDCYDESLEEINNSDLDYLFKRRYNKFSG